MPKNRIFIHYTDGTEVKSICPNLRKKLFAAWKDPAFFQKVHVDSYRQIRWSDEIELCPDALYMRLTGEMPEQFLAKAAAATAHA